MVAHPIRVDTKRVLQPRNRTWFLFGGAKELARLERLINDAKWDGSSYRAEVYRELCDYGYHRVVRRLWRKHGAANFSIEEWSQIGRALVGAHLYSEGRGFMGAWRKRPGVPMWMIANYSLCMSRFRRNQLEELRLTCRDALSGLPHDHCANFLAHILAEACALLGDREAFLQTWNTYSIYFGAELKEDEYFHPKRRHLMGDIPMMARYLQQNETWLYGKRVWKLRWATIRPDRTDGRTERQALADVPWWVWWLLFMLIMQFFRNSQ
jgi:hypothetical protein